MLKPFAATNIALNLIVRQILNELAAVDQRFGVILRQRKSGFQMTSMADGNAADFFQFIKVSTGAKLGPRTKVADGSEG
ncbi:MAG: hypothetical protein ACOH2H_25430 [Cypionkella sp.]